MNPEPIALMKGRLVYILGPMSGIEDYNRPAFREATVVARRYGVRVVSPGELDERDPIIGDAWEDYLARDLAWVARAEVGLALPGWRNSRGARLETCVLNTLGREVWEFDVKAREITRVPAVELPVPQFNL